MPNFIEHLGLEEFWKTEEDANKLIGYVIENGKEIVGYSGNSYFNHHIGWAQLIVSTQLNPENNHLEVVGFDTHADGKSAWDVRIHEIDVDDKESMMSKRVFVTREDGTGSVVINIVNADILPSFVKDEVYKLQMIAFPTEIRYFASGEEYESDEIIRDAWKNWLFEEGSVIPVGFMTNHMVPKDENTVIEHDPELDNLVAVRGVVKKLYPGLLEFGEEEVPAYVRCVIDTAFGELEIDHSYGIVAEDERDNIKLGSTVFALVVISADAANYGRDDGIIKDEENALRLMRNTFSGGNPERIRCVLADDATYTLDSNGETYRGADDIIDRIKYVQENGEQTYYVHRAIIESVDDEDENSYPVGTKCLVLASDEEDNFESIGFITVNDEGMISRIYTCMDGKYHFRIVE